ncbi:CLAVATA3/ESR (CLE)-related protein 12 [Linum grandiflorum]
MALKVSALVFLIVLLWLSFLFIIFHELYGFKTNHHHKQHLIISRRQHDDDDHHQDRPEANNYRKVLSTKFDFTRFLKPSPPRGGHHHHHRDHKGLADHGDQQGNEIDPRYGVDKRLVPSGPNPLHH